MGYSPWGCKRVRHNLGTKQQPQIQDLVPRPGIEPRPHALGAQESLPLDHEDSPQKHGFKLLASTLLQYSRQKD